MTETPGEKADTAELELEAQLESLVWYATAQGLCSEACDVAFEREQLRKTLAARVEYWAPLGRPAAIGRARVEILMQIDRRTASAERSASDE